MRGGELMINVYIRNRIICLALVFVSFFTLICVSLKSVYPIETNTQITNEPIKVDYDFMNTIEYKVFNEVGFVFSKDPTLLNTSSHFTDNSIEYYVTKDGFNSDSYTKRDVNQEQWIINLYFDVLNVWKANGFPDEQVTIMALDENNTEIVLAMVENGEISFSVCDPQITFINEKEAIEYCERMGIPYAE